MTSALERRSMSTEGSMASSASKLLPSFNATAGLSRHHRSFSENFDGSSRAELPVADPLGETAKLWHAEQTSYHNDWSFFAVADNDISYSEVQLQCNFEPLFNLQPARLPLLAA